MEQDNDDRYIIEFITMGKSVKITAIDPDTLTEVCVIAPTSLPKKEMAELAVRKLHYMLQKKECE